jgi:hypothetical protein
MARSSRAVGFRFLEQRSADRVARRWQGMAEERTAVNNGPRIVPGILGVAKPITVPTW